MITPLVMLKHFSSFQAERDGQAAGCLRSWAFRRVPPSAAHKFVHQVGQLLNIHTDMIADLHLQVFIQQGFCVLDDGWHDFLGAQL